MNKKEMVEALKKLYEKSLCENDKRLCLEILREIINVNKLTEVRE